jgi:hypothetical protein
MRRLFQARQVGHHVFDFLGCQPGTPLKWPGNPVELLGWTIIARHDGFRIEAGLIHHVQADHAHGLARTDAGQGWAKIAKVFFLGDRQYMAGQAVAAVLVASDGSAPFWIAFQATEGFIDGKVLDLPLVIGCRRLSQIGGRRHGEGQADCV